MKSLAMFAVVLGLLLGGCDVFYGPLLKNAGKEPMDVAAVYSDGSSYNVHLDPGGAFRQRVKGLAVERIVVTQGGRRAEFDSTFFRPLLARVPSPDQAVVMISESGVEIISIDEAKRKGIL